MCGNAAEDNVFAIVRYGAQWAICVDGSKVLAVDSHGRAVATVSEARRLLTDAQAAAALKAI